DRLEPLDVVLVEHAVAALRALRRQQALVLEVADLRDRDVGELRLQPPADGSDREQSLAAWGSGRHQRVRNVDRYLPICSSSPAERSGDSTRLRVTKVPLRLPWSSMNQRPSRSTRSACFLDTVTSSRKTGLSGERPIIVFSPCGTKVSPERPPPDRTMSAGPSTPRSSSASSISAPSSGLKVCVVSPLSCWLCRSAPHLAQ